MKKTLVTALPVACAMMIFAGCASNKNSAKNFDFNRFVYSLKRPG